MSARLNPAYMAEKGAYIHDIASISKDTVM
jgi:hypothetical protein